MPDETRKLTALIAELERLCADATRIREKIDQMTSDPPLWPNRRDPFRLFEPRGPRPQEFDTPSASERNN